MEIYKSKFDKYYLVSDNKVGDTDITSIKQHFNITDIQVIDRDTFKIIENIEGLTQQPYTNLDISSSIDDIEVREFFKSKGVDDNFLKLIGL